MQMLNFVRGENEYRQVSIDEDGSYRIWAQTGTIGKRHENFNEYYQHLIANGWRKVNNREYYATKYGWRDKYEKAFNKRK